MVSLNDTLYERVCEKMRESDFTEQEIQTVEQARNKLRMHTRIGAFAGATATFFMGKSKQFKPLRLLLLTGGGLVFGTQTGFIAGTLAGLRLINGLPNPQRVIGIMRDIQLETVKGTTAPLNQPRPKVQLPQNEFLSDNNNTNDGFSPDISNNVQAKEEGWESYEDKPMEKINKIETTNAWDKIRAESLPNTTWSKIRSEAQQNSMDENQIAKARAERANRLRERSEFEQELPRTREEAKRTPVRRNQFGDLLE